MATKCRRIFLKYTNIYLSSLDGTSLMAVKAEDYFRITLWQDSFRLVDYPKVQALHPPIDSLLLQKLARDDFGGKAKFWSNAYKTRWSKFDSAAYEKVIQGIRESLNGEPMWEIERFWRGHQ